jgi:polysaccharide export outer membrane protein
MNKTLSVIVGSIVLFTAVAPAGRIGAAQSRTASVSTSPAGASAAGTSPAGAGHGVPSGSENDDAYFKQIYRNFYDTYRLGPGDSLALRVYQQPDYSFEKITVSPVGRIYHPLLGDVEVSGYTVDQLKDRLTADLSQYIVKPVVSVSLIEASSARVGVIGEVVKPGIVILDRPMTILDAVSAAGGFTQFGSKSSVVLLRQVGQGRFVKREINVKHILEAKSSPEENPPVTQGDTIIVGGNAKQKVAFIASLLGFGNFIAFLARGGAGY